MVYKPAPAQANDRQYLRAELYSANETLLDANVLAFANGFDNAYESNDALKILNVAEKFWDPEQRPDTCCRSPEPGNKRRYNSIFINQYKAAILQVQVHPEKHKCDGFIGMARRQAAAYQNQYQPG